METTLYEIEFYDGRIFRIFCANSNQISRLLIAFNRIKHLCNPLREITNGIHTITQFERIAERF